MRTSWCLACSVWDVSSPGVPFVRKVRTPGVPTFLHPILISQVCF